MRNAYDNLKAKYSGWVYLKNKTGNIYNAQTNTFTLTNEEWEDFKKGHPKAGSLKTVPLPFPELCAELFDGNAATGMHKWTSTQQTSLDASSSHCRPKPLLLQDTVLHEIEDDVTDTGHQTFDSTPKPTPEPSPDRKEGPTVVECSEKLKLVGLNPIDPLFLAAYPIFGVSSDMRVTWMALPEIPETLFAFVMLEILFAFLMLETLFGFVMFKTLYAFGYVEYIVQATNEGASIPVAATIPVISAPVLPLGLSSVPTASVISPFVTPVPSARPRVTFPPSMTQFMNDPANLQAIQVFGQVMAMCQQNGGMPFLPGMFPFALPGAGTMPLQAPMAVTSFQTPMPQPSPFQPQLVSTMAPVNLAGALNAAGPSRPPQATDLQITPDGHCVSIESDDGEWDIPRAHKKKKGKNIRPATSRNSAFERLGIREEGQRKSAKQRLGQSVAHVSAFARLGEVREAEPARTRRSRSNRQEPARTRASHQEGEAEIQPRLPVANRLTIPNDRVQQMEAKLEKKVGEKNDWDKPLGGSPFTARVHLTPFPRKVKIDAPRFTGKEDPEIHLDSFNQSATMNDCTDEEKCLLFFQTLRNRATEWFNKLHPGSIDSFSDLASKFKAKFQENCTKRKKFTYLSTTGQRESEKLTQFLTRWKEEVDKVEEMDDKTVLSLLLNGLRAGELYKEFCRKPPATYQEAYHTAWEFAEAETQLRAKREAEHGHKPKPVQVKKEEAPGPSRPRHHYDPVIRVDNTEECQEVRKAPVIPPENPTDDRQWRAGQRLLAESPGEESSVG
ncbi:unnamed protein product [Cuscuta campestris]|uniref:Retrotransposon gag domain-containing protein n=1 Tax=Cuscuta campestris TaxID=132261 RepID=A0A484KW81_9ASTE|nr:unnamed protein product [Cuscuta campestris]